MRRIPFPILFLCLLVLPLSAQDDALLGTWEGNFVDEEGNAVTMRLSFQEDGVFELNQVIELGEEFRTVVESTGIPVEAIIVQGTGTWGVDGDKLSVDVTEMEMLVGDRTFLEVLTEVARALARVTADFGGISDEDYPEFEEEFVEEFLAGIDEEELAGFEDEVTWAIEGDTLSITAPTEDGGEETTTYQRVAETAVAGTTWGGLKANLRP